MRAEKGHDLDKFIRIALLTIIAIWTFQLIHPLVGVLTWGFILAVAFYPLFFWLNKRIHHHANLAAVIIVLLGLCLLVSIVMMLSNNLVNSLTGMMANIRAGIPVIPEPPASIENLPVIGKDTYRIWYLAYSNMSAALNQYSSYLISAGGVILENVASKSIDILIFALSILLSGYFMVNAQKMMVSIRQFADRISPDHGIDLIKVMKETIQNVSRGVIGISILQSSFFGLVLLYAGVPAAGLLTFLAFFICLLQVGLIFLVIPIAIWIFSVNDFIPAMIAFVLLFFVAMLDTFLKPFVLARGLRTPMMVIFIGVIGGIASYGFIGIFIGPVVLALFYELAHHWVHSHG